MALPANLAVIVVTGKFTLLNGSDASGTVTFTPQTPQGAWLKDPTATTPTIVIPNPKTLTLVAGAFSTDLPPSDDKQMSPQAWPYLVEIRLTNTNKPHYFAQELWLREGVTPVDLSAVLPV